MLHLPAMRMFALRPEGVRCGATASLSDPFRCCVAARDSYGRELWSVRPATELDDELTARYGLPIEVAAKAGGLASVARALDRGDLALAGIAAVLLQFPDPPPLEKGAPAAERLGEVGGRTRGKRPPQGRLGSGQASAHRRKAESGMVRRSCARGPGGDRADAAWPSPRVQQGAAGVGGRDVAEKGGLSEFGPYGDAAALIWELAQQLGPSALNDGEAPRDRADQRLFRSAQVAGGASDDRRRKMFSATSGITSSSRTTIMSRKTPFVKFGRDAIDDPSNLV